jgi:hypothetical protein
MFVTPPAFSLSFFATFFQKRTINNGNNCALMIQGFFEKIFRELGQVKVLKKLASISFFIQQTITTQIGEVHFAINQHNCGK